MADEWQETTIGDFAPFTYGKGLPESQRDSSGNKPVFGSNGIVGYHNRALTAGPTVVIGRKGTAGAVHYSFEACWPIDTTFYIVDDDPYVLRFKYYLLKSLKLEHMNADSAVPGLNREAAHALKVVVPPLPEQRAIAAVLGALDDKIELNRRMNRTLEAIAQAVFRHWFVENEEAEGWRETTIGEVVTVVGGSTPSTTNPAFWENGHIHWATPKDLAELQSPILLDTNSRITELGLQEISSGLLPVGTVLLSSRAPIGYLAITQIPVAINQGFIAIKCTNEVPNYFILNWLKDNMEEIIGRANGTTFLEISKSNFRSIPIFIPPSEKTKAFVEIVEPMYQKIIANLKQSRTLSALRDALLPRLMRGEVRVHPVDG